MLEFLLEEYSLIFCIYCCFYSELQFTMLSSSSSPVLSDQSGRFSPLLLDFGEYYFSDYSAQCFFHPSLFENEPVNNAGFTPLSKRQSVKGWVRVCSNSIVFDPASKKFPILRIKFEKISALELLLNWLKRFVKCSKLQFEREVKN